VYTSTVDSVITIQTHFMVITVAISQRRTKNTRKTASHCTRTNITPKSVLFSAEIEKKGSIQRLVQHIGLTSHHYAFQWMD